MNGSWHIYRPGERWQRPAGGMRIVVGTDAFVAVAFNVPVAEWLQAGRSTSSPPWRARPRPARGRLRDGTRRSRACDRAIGSGSARPCSISAPWPASATSTSRRSASSAESIRSRRSTTSRTTTCAGWCERRAGCSWRTSRLAATRPSPRIIRSAARRAGRMWRNACGCTAAPGGPATSAGRLSNARSRAWTRGARPGIRGVRGDVAVVLQLPVVLSSQS